MLYLEVVGELQPEEMGLHFLTASLMLVEAVVASSQLEVLALTLLVSTLQTTLRI